MSLRNVNKRFRKANKERAQPADRKRFGLLEKHKDYVKRARDFSEKKEQMRALQEKAALRNKDEFFFHMEHTRTGDDGKHHEQDKTRLQRGALQQVKQHEYAYLMSERQKEKSAVERMQKELHFLDVQKPSTHIVFVDDEDEAEKFDAAEYFGTVPELVKGKRPRVEDLKNYEFEEPKEVEKKRRKAYKELSSRVKRKAVLDDLVDRVQLQRQLMTDKKATVVAEDAQTGKKVYKWQQIRKK